MLAEGKFFEAPDKKKFQCQGQGYLCECVLASKRKHIEGAHGKTCRRQKHSHGVKAGVEAGMNACMEVGMNETAA